MIRPCLICIRSFPRVVIVAAVIPDSVRRGLMDALKEHLKVLGLHWLANVKDAVRLNQVGGEMEAGRRLRWVGDQKTSRQHFLNRSDQSLSLCGEGLQSLQSSSVSFTLQKVSTHFPISAS